MIKKRQENSGFTLIEVMIGFAIVGVLAALAIPAYVTFVNRAKSGEAAMHLGNMFKAAANYYSLEHGVQGLKSSASGSCTVASTAPSPTPPRKFKQTFVADPNFASLGFAPSERVHYEYSLVSEIATCANLASDDTIYTLTARGDLNGDGKTSTFEIAVGSSRENVLKKAKGLYIVDEYE